METLCPDTTTALNNTTRYQNYRIPGMVLANTDRGVVARRRRRTRTRIDQTCRLAVCMVQPSAIANMISVDPIVIEWSIDCA